MHQILRAPNLDEGVDGHDGHVRLGLCIVHQIEIHQLLQLKIVRLHAVDDVRKQSTGYVISIFRGKSANLTSFPTVMFAMIFLIASRFSAFLALARACFSSNTSPELLKQIELEY